MFGIFPKNNTNQVLILKRFFIASASYLLVLCLGMYGVFTGTSLISPSLVPLILGGLLLSNLYFYSMIRSGASKRFEDESLTVPQIVIALAWFLLLMFADAENRGAFLSVYVMIMMFGLFRLRRAQIARLSIYALCAYSALLAVEYFFFRWRFNPTLELAHYFVLVGMLIWSTLFAGHVSRLREVLKRRNRDLSAALEEIGKLASHDDLTQTYNRRYIMQELANEKARADRTNSKFSVCILDLDRFKTINDRFGHLAGDRVLLAFSERIKGALRGMDLIDAVDGSRFFGRYGGEEFIVVLPDTPMAGAMRCAERIRKVTAETPFDEVFTVTLSAGISQYKAGESIEDTLRRADAALYEAKERGRNRVMADDGSATDEYEMAIGDHTKTNIVVGSFGTTNTRFK